MKTEMRDKGMRRPVEATALNKHVAADLEPYRQLISLQRQYASWTGLGLLDQSLVALEERLAAARANGRCVICLGWGGGLTAKSAWLDTTNPEYRQILQAYTIYNRALASNLPFPKTRKIVFLNNRPATLPGWAELEVV